MLMPMALPGLASTGLLLVILSWNEAFWSINLIESRTPRRCTVFIASYSSPEGLVLGEALGGVAARGRADPDRRLAVAEATRPRADVRRGEVSRRRS